MLGDITLNAVQRYGFYFFVFSNVLLIIVLFRIINNKIKSKIGHYFDMPFEGPFHGHPLQEGIVQSAFKFIKSMNAIIYFFSSVSFS